MQDSKDPEEVFEILERIGEGSYGSVFTAVHKLTGKVVAIKIVPVDQNIKEFMEEISILKLCNSDYIVRYYGSYYKDNDLWIVMEYCNCGSLGDLMMKGRFTLKEDEIRYVISEVLMGVAYLHSKKIIHRDIKSGNILLSKKGVAKLADFGVSARLNSTFAKRKTIIGTPFWMAPEVIQQENYDCQADIWSIGITAIELAEGLPPYSNELPMRALFYIPQRPPPRLKNESNYSPEFIDFIAQCLTKDPRQRPSSQQLLSHPFVASTIERVKHHCNVSNTMLAMIDRLTEKKKLYLKAKKPEQPKNIPKDNSHGVDDTLIQNDENDDKNEPDDKTENQVKNEQSNIPTDSTIQFKVSKQPAKTIVQKGQVPPLPAISHAQRPTPITSAIPSPPGRNLPPPATRNPPLMIQSTKPNPGKKIINVDQVTSMYLPDIPATRPTNESNLSDWIKLQRKANELQNQFKSDFQMLVTSYSDDMLPLIEQMKSYCN